LWVFPGAGAPGWEDLHTPAKCQLGQMSKVSGFSQGRQSTVLSDWVPCILATNTSNKGSPNFISSKTTCLIYNYI